MVGCHIPCIGAHPTNVCHHFNWVGVQGQVHLLVILPVFPGTRYQTASSTLFSVVPCRQLCSCRWFHLLVVEWYRIQIGIAQGSLGHWQAQTGIWCQAGGGPYQLGAWPLFQSKLIMGSPLWPYRPSYCRPWWWMAGGAPSCYHPCLRIAACQCSGCSGTSPPCWTEGCRTEGVCTASSVKALLVNLRPLSEWIFPRSSISMVAKRLAYCCSSLHFPHSFSLVGFFPSDTHVRPSSGGGPWFGLKIFILGPAGQLGGQLREFNQLKAAPLADENGGHAQLAPPSPWLWVCV